MSSDSEALGNELHEARQRRDLTLDQAEKQTRIRAKYLEALEQGNYTVLPTPVQTRGFLRNYARFLGLDGDLVVAQYDTALQGGRRRGRRPNLHSAAVPAAKKTQPTQPVIVAPAASFVPVPDDIHDRRGHRSWLGTLVIGVVVLALFGAVLFFGAQGLQSFLASNNSGGPNNGVILTPLSSDASPTAPPASPAKGPTATPVRPTPLPIPAQPATAPVGASGVTLQLQITERTWLRVIVDGSVIYVGSAAPDTMLQYQGNRIQLRAANGVGVHAVFNGQDLGVLGARGQSIDQTFTAGGVVKASPTPEKPGGNPPGDTGPATEQSANTSPGATFSFPAPLSATAPATARPHLDATATLYPTLPPTATHTPTPTVTFTPTMTLTPRITATPTPTFTPSITFTPSVTPLALPHDTSTAESGEIRPK